MHRTFQTVDLRMQKKPLNKGFTMIELMVVLAIMAIITLVAYPSYQESMRKTRRSDGIAAALRIQVAQEKFRANCRFYAENLGAANNCAGDAAASTVLAPSFSDEGFYAMTIEGGSGSGNSYTIVATPQGAQAADTACSPMKIAFGAGFPNGNRTPASCWP